jgi:hypothetical protein
MQRNFNTDKIRNKSYVLQCGFIYKSQFVFHEKRKASKIGVVSPSSKKCIKTFNLYHSLSKQVHSRKLPSTKLANIKDGRQVLDAFTHLLSLAIMSHATAEC